MQFVLAISRGGAVGVTYADLEKKFNLSNASVSRCVNALSANARHRKTQFDLVEIFRDLDEGRKYRIRLSPKGMAMIKTIESI